MADFIFPTAAELKLVEQEMLPRLQQARRIFEIIPITEINSHLLMWEQRDNYLGLQQVRGLNGQPNRVKAIGGKRYVYEPGVYGEFMPIDETELTTRRNWGGFSGPVTIDDLVVEKQQQLLQRRLDRIEQIGWGLIATGTFSVSQSGAVMHTDSYTTQTYAAGVAWATLATSTPLADFRAVQLKSRGYSVNFGATATAYMNRTTFNAMLSNTNAADLGGRRGAGLSTINGPKQLNELMAMDDLPTLSIYDDGYYDDTSTFQLFVPNNKVLVVGARRDNDPIGEYRMTRNANNPDLGPGPYTKVVDLGEDQVPRRIEVHDGHNGGPVLYHPSAIVVMTV